MLANIAVPLLGIADTAIIGHRGDSAALGAIALGGLMLSFLYWAFGFLRMGTTAQVAAASGAGADARLRGEVQRALQLGAGIGLVLLLLHKPLLAVGLSLLDASDAVLAGVDDYISIRIWAAPATLMTYAVLGTLIGLGRTRHLLWLQLLLNGLNLALDILFAVVLDYGLRGIAMGTVIAEWCALAAGLYWLRGLLPNVVAAKAKRGDWRQLLNVHANLFWRTLFLLLGMMWFANAGARIGDLELAANHLLLQFISFSAFFLDGYAYVVEAQVGQARGAGQRHRLVMVIRRTTVLAVATAVALATLLWSAGPWLIALLTSLPDVQSRAAEFLPCAALYVLLSCAAFQLDGLCIGLNASAPMRNATGIALVLFLLADAWLTPRYGNLGLWWAFILFVLARALALWPWRSALAAKLPSRT